MLKVLSMVGGWRSLLLGPTLLPRCKLSMRPLLRCAVLPRILGEAALPTPSFSQFGACRRCLPLVGALSPGSLALYIALCACLCGAVCV
jgi:hypothetical protein